MTRTTLADRTHIAYPLPFQMRHARFFTAPVEEGAGAPAGGGDAAAAAAAPAAAAQAATGQQGDGQAPEGGWPTWDGNVESLPEPIQAVIRKERDDAAKQRRGKVTAETDVLAALAQTLGLELPNATPTVESLSKDLAARTGETEAERVAREAAERDRDDARREAAVLRAAGRLRNVDGDGLLDSRDFLATIKDLDPAKIDDVEKAVKEYAAKHPRFTVRATGASAVDHTAGSGTGTTRPDMTLAEATERTMAGLG